MAYELERFPDQDMIIEIALPQLGEEGCELEPGIAEKVVAAVADEDMRPVTVDDLNNSTAALTALVWDGFDWDLAGFVRQARENYRIPFPKHPATGLDPGIEFSLTEVSTLWVAPQYRGRNVGEELVRAATHQFRRNSVVSFALCNPAGQKTFENFGYTPVREVGDRTLELYPAEFNSRFLTLELWYAGLAQYLGDVLVQFPRFQSKISA